MPASPWSPVDRNPIDAVWPDRPGPPLPPAWPHPLALAGRSAAEKRAEIAAALREAKQDAAVITDPASIAWLLNIRGAMCRTRRSRSASR